LQFNSKEIHSEIQRVYVLGWNLPG
jgi:hypothetical protein